MKIDIHTHLFTRWTPWTLEPDFVNRTQDFVLPKIEEKGLDGIALVNFADFRFEIFVGGHSELYSAKHLDNASVFKNRETGKEVVVIKGQELPVDERYHVLLLGDEMDSAAESGVPLERAYKFARNKGLTMIADHALPRHPLGSAKDVCIGVDRLIENKDCFHAFEARNGNYANITEQEICDLEKKIGLPATVGSDCHDLKRLGSSYLDIEVDLSSANNLRDSLATNIFSGNFVRYSEPRNRFAYLVQSGKHIAELVPLIIKGKFS